MFLKQEKRLRSYPLYPYLQALEYEIRINRLKHKEVVWFLNKYPDAPFAERLRLAWLNQLKDKQRWAEYTALYQESALFPDKELECYYAQALMHQGNLHLFQEQFKKLWLVSFSQPKPCDRVFRWADEQNMIDDVLIWKRVLLVFDKKRSLATYLARKLKAENRFWYKLLKQARANPTKTLRKIRQDPQLKYFKAMRDVAAYALLRIVRQQPQEAERLWSQLRVSYPLEERNLLQKKLAIRMMHHLHSDIAYRLFEKLKPLYHDEDSRATYIRAAIHLNNPYKIAKAIKLLPLTEREQPQWRYWQAHSLYASGKRQQAQVLWAEMAKQPGYYHFLAADRLNKPYQLVSPPVRFPESVLRDFKKHPRVKRMQELMALKKYIEARREFFIAKEFSAEEYLKLAVLMERWDWYDGAIRAIARSGRQGETQLRFPMPYLDIAEREAKRYKHISVEMVMGLIRRESAFIEKAKSSAGALGLMQLMPATARTMLRDLRLGQKSAWSILSPQTNIRLGTAYLARLYKRYNYNLMETLCAYNAGGVPLRRWQKAQKNRHALIFAETIPYKETRNYVRAVLYYMTIYAHRLDKEPQRLSHWMDSKQ